MAMAGRNRTPQILRLATGLVCFTSNDGMFIGNIRASRHLLQVSRNPFSRYSGVVAGGGGGRGAVAPPSDNFLGALKFVIPM